MGGLELVRSCGVKYGSMEVQLEGVRKKRKDYNQLEVCGAKKDV